MTREVTVGLSCLCLLALAAAIRPSPVQDAVPAAEQSGTVTALAWWRQLSPATKDGYDSVRVLHIPFAERAAIQVRWREIRAHARTERGVEVHALHDRDLADKRLWDDGNVGESQIDNDPNDVQRINVMLPHSIVTLATKVILLREELAAAEKELSSLVQKELRPVDLARGPFRAPRK